MRFKVFARDSDAYANHQFDVEADTATDAWTKVKEGPIWKTCEDLCLFVVIDEQGNVCAVDGEQLPMLSDYN